MLQNIELYPQSAGPDESRIYPRVPHVPPLKGLCSVNDIGTSLGLQSVSAWRHTHTLNNVRIPDRAGALAEVCGLNDKRKVNIPWLTNRSTGRFTVSGVTIGA
jgi:hypothetical protein